jgi:hypothetical protein
MDVETPAGGQRQDKGVCTGEEEDVPQRHPGKALPRGVVPSSLECWPWKARDVTQEAHDVIQLHGRFGRQSWQFGTCGRLEKPKEG